MDVKRDTRLLWGLAYGLALAYLFFTVFRAPAFIHGEMIGQAHFWNDPSQSFLTTLFDPNRNQEYSPGRFRYVEYLAEALYWKGVGAGLLPKELYDYGALLATLLIGFALTRIARLLQLSRGITFLCVVFFLWSVPTFMVHAWHYRKAKYLVSLWLVLFIWRALAAKDRKSWVDPLLIGLTVLGSFTDPYFILMAPAVAVAHDLFSRNRPRASVSVLSGFAITAPLVALLNGVIGPKFSALCALVASNIPGKSWQFLNPKHIPDFHYILPDLFGPLVFHGWATLFRPWVWCLLLVAGLGCLWKVHRRGRDLNFSLLFACLACLPIAAYLVYPASGKAMYATYYGHPLFLLFVLAWMNLFGLVRALNAQKVQYAAVAVLLVCIVAHQKGRRPTFEYWTGDHVGAARPKVAADTANIRRLRLALKESTSPLTVDLDYSQLAVKEYFPCCYHLVEGPQEHTNIAYYLYPVLFRREIGDGRLQIRAH